MAFGALYTNGALVIHTTAEASAVKVGNITNLALPPGIATASPQSGSLYDYFRSIVSEAFVAAITTESIAQILDTLGAIAKCITFDGTHPGVVMYGEKHDECLGRASGSVHNTYTIEDGLLVPLTLECSHGANATISMNAIATKGTNDPVQMAYNVALPTGVTSDEVFGLGVCKVGGQQLDNVQSVSIDFGIQTMTKSGAGELAPQWASPSKIRPVISVTTTDPTIVDAAKLDIEGTTALHTDTIFQLRKRAAYGKYVADATTEHIEITAAGLITIDQMHSASGESDAAVTIKIEGVHDGTDVPLVIDTAAVYTATP